MCGIIGFVGREGGEHVQDHIINQFEEQKSRGEKGFGLVAVTKNKYTVRRAVGPMKALIDVTRSPEPILVFHHRFPTSTDNKLDQTHPIEVRLHDLTYDYLIVHNGVISNATKLKNIHMNDLGYIYTTLQKKEESASYSKYGYASSSYYHSDFNDSEALAIELARYLDGKADVIDIEGSAAFMGLKVDKKTHKPLEVFWGTNGRNPLVYNETEDGLMVASELEDGYDTATDTIHIIKVKDIFDPKKKKTPLLDLENVFELNFTKPEPIKPVVYTPPATKVELPFKKDVEPKIVGVTTTEKMPSGFTEREWAFRKMAERQAANIYERIISFGDDLAAMPEAVMDWASYNGPGQSEETMTEDLVEEILAEVEETLNTMVKRGDAINTWVTEDPKDPTSAQVEDAAMMKALEEQYEQDAHASDPTSAEFQNVGDVPLTKWLV